MSQENVKAFYERLAQDKVFKARIEEAQTKQKCSQIVREAGYDFTQEEFEAFTAQLLDSSAELNSGQLGEAELEAAVGGFFQDKVIDPVPMYGLSPEIFE